jgi:Helix-turn-helix domain
MPDLSGRCTTSDKVSNTGLPVTSAVNTELPVTGAAQAWSPDDILDTVEAAAYLRLSISSLNKMRCTGSGPAFIRMGRSVRYRRRALDLFIESRCTTSTTDADQRLPTRLSDSLVTCVDDIGSEQRTGGVARSLGTNNDQAPSQPAAKRAATRGAP